jgi:hypothetical protein
MTSTTGSARRSSQAAVPAAAQTSRVRWLAAAVLITGALMGLIDTRTQRIR